MKIELVCPAAEDTAFIKSLAIATLAAHTPRDVALTLRDDIVGKLSPLRDLNTSADLAAITVSTKTAKRAYELAAHYRAHGVPVVLGGIHPTACPEEALEHADAVAIGEAEGLWEAIVADARQGTLRRTYAHEQLPPYTQARKPRWDLFTSPRYVPVYTVQASRGCPCHCEFCSVPTFFGHRLRRRDVANVVQEIEQLDRRWLMFADDDLFADPRYGRALVQALAKLRLTWFGQASLKSLEDPAHLKLLAASGCQVLFVGFESVNEASLAGVGKRDNAPSRYVELVRRAREEGIALWGSFVLGLDDDGPDVFQRTLELVHNARMFIAQFAIQTPYPKTPLYERLRAENRLLRPRWWLDTTGADFPVYLPRKMSPEALHTGWQWLWREFYRGRSILERLPAATTTSLFAMAAYLPINLHMRRLARRKVIEKNRFFSRDA